MYSPDMHPLKTLVCPETVHNSKDVGLLRSLFSEVFYYRPTENDSVTATGEPCCSYYAPAPLGEELPRFKRLLQDLKGHEDEFYKNYLTSLSNELLAGNSDEQLWTLISQISPAVPKIPSPNVSQDHHLWQARLYLSLQEIYLQEEKEIAEGLSVLQEKKNNLLKTLRDADFDEDHDRFPVQGAEKDLFPAKNIQSALSSWARLFLQDKNPDYLAVTFTNQAAIAHVRENVNRLCSCDPVSLLSIPLVLPAAEDTALPVARHSEHDSTFEPLRGGIAEILAGLALGDNDIDAGRKKLAAIRTKWHELLTEKRHQRHPVRVLTFFLLPGASLYRFFGALCRTAMKTTPSPLPPHGLIAFLEEADPDA